MPLRSATTSSAAARSARSSSATTGYVAPNGPDLPALVLCAHGTANPVGQATLHSIANRVRVRRPELDVTLAYVDVQEPTVAGAVREYSRRGIPSVLVPLLMTTGHHVLVDVAAAVADDPMAVATGALAPDPLLATLVVDRLLSAGARPGDPVVLAFAGSGEARAYDDAQTLTDAVRHNWPGHVALSFGRREGRTCAEVVAEARLTGSGRVAIAPALVAEGHFFDILQAAGADVVARPLGAHGTLVSLIEQRYETGAAKLARRGALVAAS